MSIRDARMKAKVWQIGLVGTFDVENYGDLLFPLLAEAELTQRLGPIKLHRFSYHTRTTPDWPYEVESLTELPRLADDLDAIIIGGGFLIRFDKEVAPGYQPPEPLHHPTAYWLTPALIGLQHGIPVAWNAPGLHSNEVPDWAAPLMKLVIDHSAYFAVRDVGSRERLAPYTRGRQISVVPDTGFGIDRLLPEEASRDFLDLLETAGMNKPYIIVQAALGLDSFFRFVRTHSDQLRDYQLLALPIGPVLGDDASILASELPGVVSLPAWPHPLLLAELISHAAAVIGHSYHLVITALVHGVPVFTPQDLTVGKYAALAGFESIYPLPSAAESTATGNFESRLGKRDDVGLNEIRGQVSNHWNQIASVIRAGRIDTQAAVGRFWQSLPGLLEHPAVSISDRSQELEQELSARNIELDQARAEIATLNNRIAEFQGSSSWRLTAPLRALRGRVKPSHPREIIDLRQIITQRMNREPYSWAIINHLFTPQTEAALSRTFPLDHFKPVRGIGGEKDYEYDVRALVRMGADKVSNSRDLREPWFSLAKQFLSAAYRGALSDLIEFDLSQALLEVNTFHYGPKAVLGPHCDLPDKIVTHVIYFNETWDRQDGGCLTILNSAAPSDVVAEVPPIVGSSAVLVRSENSWHAVTPVAGQAPESRRSLTATFYHPGSVSSLWPAGDRTQLRRFEAKEQAFAS